MKINSTAFNFDNMLYLYKLYLVTYFRLRLETLGNRQLLEGDKIYHY